jgi:hypothetical protein
MRDSRLRGKGETHVIRKAPIAKGAWVLKVKNISTILSLSDQRAPGGPPSSLSTASNAFAVFASTATIVSLMCPRPDDTAAGGRQRAEGARHDR